ncbi:MAG: hypothetical protein WCC39_15470 [Telluria sp.]
MGFLMNADAHRAAVEHMRPVNDLLNENDKEQSGAETVKIAARIARPKPYFNRSSPRDGAILQ